MKCCMMMKIKATRHKQGLCNKSFFLQLLQVACKFSASCIKLVLQHCIAGVHTSAMQLQYKKNILVLQLYCSCIAPVRTALATSGEWKSRANWLIQVYLENGD